jgi:hypothetical protein
MDKRKKIAYSFFEQKNDMLVNIVNDGIEKCYVNNKFILEFEFLFGIKDTLGYFIEWIINEKKVNISEPFAFVYRNRDWMRMQGLTWTEILQMRGVKKPIKFIYTDGKLLEIDDLTNNYHGINPEQALELKMN